MAYSYHDGKELVLDPALARLVPLAITSVVNISASLLSLAIATGRFSRAAERLNASSRSWQRGFRSSVRALDHEADAVSVGADGAALHSRWQFVPGNSTGELGL
jgi:hypothetical protein